MGEVIRRRAAVDDILADVATTLQRASAKGGDWQAPADERLRPVLTLTEAVQGQLRAAAAAAAPLVAALGAANQRADALVGRISDEVWNIVGRPSSDPALSILFPGGIAYYADGTVEDQPDRMTVLAELLEAGIHPKLPREKATAYAREVREEAGLLRTAADAARSPRVRQWLFERVRTAVARSAQIELVNLKRHYASLGRSDAEIHSVIPDRPRPTKPEVPSEDGGSPPA